MSKIDELEKIQKLKEEGVLTETEFENEKNKILKKDVKPEEVTNNITENIDKEEKNKNNENNS